MTKVRVTVPADLWPSMVIGASGENYPVEVDSNGERFVTMSRDDARALLVSPFSPPAWLAANPEVAESLRRGLELARSS